MFKFYFILLLALSTTLAFDQSDKENEVVQKSNTAGHMRKSRVQRTGSGNHSSTSRVSEPLFCSILFYANHSYSYPEWSR
jgi:hypothetical protein